ncbi:MAG TPA: hypothetical protein VN132_06305 [Bdellovibrio sp.]|nr:hypothetical protein [Bdellovibrio sp.]
MNLDDLKDQLTSEGRAVWERIQDSAAFNQLRDRYENMSPSMQKMSVIGAALIIVLLILSVPYSNFTQSNEFVTDFEDKRTTIRQLLKVSRESADIPNIPQAPAMEMIRSTIENHVKMANLLPEQVKGTNVNTVESKLIPVNLVQGALDVSLAKLNLRQVMDMGYRFQTINPSVKLKDMIVTANLQDNRYFDVIYKLVALAVPTAPEAPPAEEPTKGKGKSSRTKKTEEKTEE